MKNLRLSRPAIAALALVCWVSPCLAQVSRPITEFGAVSDAATLNTASIQKGIDTLAAGGGGTLVVPQGTFLTGSLFLKPGVNLHLDRNAVLKGTTDLKDYPLMETRIEGHFQQWVPALINVDKCDNIRIDGEGTLDGSGPPFWQAFRTAIQQNRGTKNLDVPRPRLMFIRDSKNVTVSGIHFKDSGFWNLHLYRCQDVTIENLDIRAGESSPSCDGMDIDSCQRVTIKGCHIFTNDDCIALKGSKGVHAMDDKDSPPVEHIRVSDCTFERGGSFVTCGSEATIVRDVVVENCKAIGSSSGGMSMLRLKLRTDTPQFYSDMHFRNITLEGNGALIGVAPWTQYEDLQGQPRPTHTVRNITMSNIKGAFGTFGSIRPNPGDTIEEITLQDIDVKLTPPQGRGARRGASGPATAPVAAAPTTGIARGALPSFQGVTNVTFKNVKINGELYNP
jgi:alpha-L-rhamnosidase